MLLQFAREYIEDFAVKGTWRTIMFKNFNNALRNIRILDYGLFKISRCNFFNFSCLLKFLRLIEMLNLAIKEFIYKFIQILLNVIEEDNLSVLLEVEIVIFKR
jgi:hypothetical protein